MIIAGAVPGNEGINAEPRRASGAGVIAQPGDVGMVVTQCACTASSAAMGRNARALVLAQAADRVIDVALATTREATTSDAA